jgi:hypothetical protein
MQLIEMDENDGINFYYKIGKSYCFNDVNDSLFKNRIKIINIINNGINNVSNNSTNQINDIYGEL